MKHFVNSALSLKIKLPLSIVMIVIIAFTISTILTLNNFTSVVHSVRDSHLQSAAEVIGENIDTQIKQAGRDMVMAASLPNVLQAVEMPPALQASPKYIKTRAYLTTLFERILLAYGYYNAFYIVNEKGEYIVGTAPLAQNLMEGEDSIPFKEAMSKNGFSIGPTLYKADVERVIVPIFLEVVYNGYGGALVSSLHISKIINTAIRESPNTDMISMVFAVNDSSYVEISESSHDTIPLGPWVNAFKGKTSGILNVSIEGAEHAVGYYNVPQTDIYAIAVAKESYMLLPSTILRHSTLITNAVTVLIIMLCVCYFTVPVAKDISHLSLFAKSITEGKEGMLLSSPRKDEIGHLTVSLGHMVSTLKDMVVRSESATKAKSDFLACMSHEIRTPMNGILGTTYLAMRSDPGETQLNYLKRIDTAAKTLLGVINDILDFSKIEAEKMDINNITFRISTMLTSMRDMLQPKSDERDIWLDFSVDENVPDIIFCDPLRLSQICINLCSNAIKFTSVGGVHMHISIAERDKENIVLLISVKDTGIGIKAEEQEHIFDSFAQADNSTTRKYGGTGLGLAISKSLVHLLGGNIWVDSTFNTGSTFSFTVKVIEGFEADLEEVNESVIPSIEQSIPNLRILLVEDNEINQEIALEILKNMGGIVTLAHNGAEAVSIFEQEEFDLILMDIQMPIMDGLTAAQTIRNSSHPLAHGIPIVAMTAHAMASDREKSLQAGMNDHITKPLKIDELYNVLVFWGSAVRSEKKIG